MYDHQQDGIVHDLNQWQKSSI